MNEPEPDPQPSSTPTNHDAADGDGAAAPAPPMDPMDPVLARRMQIARWSMLGKRIGYSALAVAVAVFSVALYWDLPAALIGIIVACLVVACVTLAPSIVFGYGVMAADREDRELGRTPAKPAPPRRGHT